MEVIFPFHPSGPRGREVDESVRRGAADSIAVLGKAIVAQRPELRIALQRWSASVRAGPVRPGLFALYSHVVESIFRDDEPAFRSAVDAIAQVDPEAPKSVRA